MLESVPAQSPMIPRIFFTHADSCWNLPKARRTGPPPGPVSSHSCWSLDFVSPRAAVRIYGKAGGRYVYVTAKQTFLRDRVAAVSNRTGTVENGEKLEVLEHGGRFFRVKAPQRRAGLD